MSASSQRVGPADVERLETDLDRMLEELNEQTRQAEAHFRSVSEAEITVRVGRGDIAVRLDGTGRLHEVEIDPALLRAGDAVELGDLIVEAVNTGFDRAAQANVKALRP